MKMNSQRLKKKKMKDTNISMNKKKRNCNSHSYVQMQKNAVKNITLLFQFLYLEIRVTLSFRRGVFFFLGLTCVICEQYCSHFSTCITWRKYRADSRFRFRLIAINATKATRANCF